MNFRWFIICIVLPLLLILVLAPVVEPSGTSLVPQAILPYLSAIGGCGIAGICYFLHFSRRNAAIKLEQNQAKLMQEIAALNHHAMVSLSDNKAGLFYANEKFLEVTDYALDEIFGKQTDILYETKDLSLFETIRQGLNRGQTWSGETRLRCKNGSTIWTQTTVLPRLDQNGKLIGSISIRTDITAAKISAAQKDLYTSLHKLWDEVYIIDPKTLAFCYMNEAAMDRVGWSAEEYKTKFVWDDNANLQIDLFKERIAGLTRGDADEVNYPDLINGTPYEIRMQLITTYSGESQLLAVLRDTSEQVRIENAKSELLATISHELRTPMTSIKGAIGLLLSSAAGDLPEKARGMLSIAYRNADRLVAIINDILDIEKIAAGHMEFDIKNAPLATVLDEAIAANEQFANRFDVSVEKKNVNPDIMVNFDFGRTLQVVTNLLSNAAKFSPPGGKIIVSMTEFENSVRIGVQDFGEGISEEALARIFERFAQESGRSHRGVAGTGLGLNISKVIMEQQGGSISVVSEVGAGSTFFVDFPRDTNGIKYDPAPISLAM